MFVNQWEIEKSASVIILSRICQAMQRNMISSIWLINHFRQDEDEVANELNL